MTTTTPTNSRRAEILEFLTCQPCSKITTNKNWTFIIDLLCRIADGKTKSCARDLATLTDKVAPHAKKGFVFDDFSFDEKHRSCCKIEFLMLDFIFFFQSNIHSAKILDSTSNYSFNQIKRILNMIENHHTFIQHNYIGHEAYFYSFSAHLIERCLHLQLQSGDFTGVFHKIFGILIAFIRRHDCAVGTKSPTFGAKIYEFILANHFHDNIDKKSMKIYFQDYINWVTYQLLWDKQRYKSKFRIKARMNMDG